MKKPFPALFRPALPLLLVGSAFSATVSYNSGSLGPAADGVNSDGVTLYQPGATSAPGDRSVGYSAGAVTTVAFQSSLNPVTTSAFSIEFWARPTASDNDDVPVNNRVGTGDRSGWVFFQRAAGTGWNFRMYNGAGSTLGWDLTGGTSTLNAWSHVVATWNGSAATLYVNGALADSTNTAGLNGIYNPNTANTVFSIGALADAGSGSNGLVDEVAFYGSALSEAQILNHFNLAASTTPGAYNAAVSADGALLHLTNVPEPTTALLAGFGGLALLRRRSRPAL